MNSLKVSYKTKHSKLPDKYTTFNLIPSASIFMQTYIFLGHISTNLGIKIISQNYQPLAGTVQKKTCSQ